MLFDSRDQVTDVGLVGIVAYVALIVVMRISGKRTLAKLNAFDRGMQRIRQGDALTDVDIPGSVTGSAH